MSTTTVLSAAATDSVADGSEYPELAAFNAAFDVLDLDWHWDLDLYLTLPHDGDDRATLSAYLRGHRSHLLKVYDLTFLCDAILAAKKRDRIATGPATH